MLFAFAFAASTSAANLASAALKFLMRPKPNPIARTIKYETKCNMAFSLVVRAVMLLFGLVLINRVTVLARLLTRALYRGARIILRVRHIVVDRRQRTPRVSFCVCC